MKLEYRPFGGMRPAVDERVLERVEATDAVDCDLRYKTVKPFLQPDPATLAAAPRVPLGYEAASEVPPVPDVLYVEDAGTVEANGTYYPVAGTPHYSKGSDPQTFLIEKDRSWGGESLENYAYQGSEDIAPIAGTPDEYIKWVEFTPDGLHYYIYYFGTASAHTVAHFETAVPFDYANAVKEASIVSTPHLSPWYLNSCSISPDGKTLSTISRDIHAGYAFNLTFDEWDLPTPFQLAGATPTGSKASALKFSFARGHTFTNEGRTLVLCDYGNFHISEWDLAAPYSLLSIADAPTSSLNPFDDTNQSAYVVVFNPLGTQLYVLSSSGLIVYDCPNVGSIKDAVFVEYIRLAYDFTSAPNGAPEWQEPMGLIFTGAGDKFHVGDGYYGYRHINEFDTNFATLAVEGWYLGSYDASDAYTPLYFNPSVGATVPLTLWELNGGTATPPTLSLPVAIPGGGTSDISHLHDILHNEGGEIPEGLYEVNERGTCIASSVVARDEHERVYFSRPDGGIYDRGRTGGVGDFVERAVGIAAPVAPDGIQTPATSPRADPDPVAFTPLWRYYVEVKDTGEQVAQGVIQDADTSVIFSYDTNDINEPVYRYVYDKDIRASSGSGHVAYGGAGDTYDRTVYNFIMYAELASDKGRFLGTVYPEPSVRQGDTDAYIGGTLASGITHQGVWDDPSPVYIEFTDLLAIPAGTEYSHYHSYLFTYVSDRGEESAPSAATDPLAVLPTYKVELDIDVANAPDSAVAIRLYRTETTEAGTAFFFVEEILLVGDPNDQNPDPAVIEYTDFTIAVDLDGDTLQTLNWFPPPADLKGLVLSTKGYYAGYAGSKLYLSEMFLAYAWPEDYAIDFTGDISHIARYGDMLCVFTDREIALIVGNNPLEVRKIKVEGFELLTSIYSTTEMDGILYFATPIGVAAVSGTNVAVVTDDLVSERWWRDNINVQEVRIVSFDNALYVLQAPDGQFYRVGLAEDGGGFVRLSDEFARDAYTSSFYRGVAILKSTEIEAYIFNIGADVPRTVTWRSRTEVADIPMAVISVRVLAEAYPVTFRIYEGDAVDPIFAPITLTSDKVRKLPVMRRGREWSFEIEGATNIVSLEVGTSGRVR